jgi:hypothetical protein
MANNVVTSLESGIYEGICSACPWYGKTIDNVVCTRTAINSIVDVENIRGENQPNLNFEAAKVDLSDRADDCARTLIRAALQDNPQPLEPTETLRPIDVALLLMQHTVNK